MTHAYSNGVLRHVSPTQVKEFSRCKRKWYYNKVKHIPQPQKGSAELGEQVHKQMQDYYEAGTPVEHPSAVEILQDPMTPPRGPGLLIEFPRDYKLGLTAAGVSMIGRLDLVDLRDENHTAIWDWKTTRDFRYAMKREELEKDIQAITYAKWAFKRYTPQGVTITHGYIRTKTPGYKIVTTDPLSAQYVDDTYAGIEATVHEMQETAQAEDAEKVEGNDKACNDFGGCPYQGICSVAAKLFPSSETPVAANPISLKERLAARRKVTEATASSALPVSPLRSTGTQ